MPKLKLSKSSLHRQQEQLKLYKRLLPSLVLKRRQLTVEAQKAEAEYETAKSAVAAPETRIGAELPMLADEEFRPEGRVRLTRYKAGERNVVGVRLRILESVECQVADYARRHGLYFSADETGSDDQPTTCLMILADAGDATLLGPLLLLCWRKLSRSETGRRYRGLGAGDAGSKA